MATTQDSLTSIDLVAFHTALTEAGLGGLVQIKDKVVLSSTGKYLYLSTRTYRCGSDLCDTAYPVEGAEQVAARVARTFGLISKWHPSEKGLGGFEFTPGV